MTRTKSLITAPFLIALEHGMSRVALWLSLGAMALLSACGGGSGGSGADTPLPELPTLTITSDAGQVASETFKLRLAFSAPVVFWGGNFAYCDSSIGTATCSIQAKTPTAVDGVANTYTIEVKPNAQQSGLVVIKIPAGAYKDASGRVSSSIAYEFPQYINTVGPQGKFTPNPSSGLFTKPFTITLTFDSILDDPLTKDQLLVSDGAISDFRKTSVAGNDVYQFVYTPPTNIAGGVTIVLPVGAVKSGGIKNATLEQWGPFIAVLVP